jgi:hypothetical protein
MKPRFGATGTVAQLVAGLLAAGAVAAPAAGAAPHGNALTHRFPLGTKTICCTTRPSHGRSGATRTNAAPQTATPAPTRTRTAAPATERRTARQRAHAGGGVSTAVYVLAAALLILALIAVVVVWRRRRGPARLRLEPIEPPGRSEPTHPIAVLRARLEEEFSTDLPPGVHPISAFCGEPQFFPGATGLLGVDAWTDVTPSERPPANGVYPDADVRVIVVGNFQATRPSYERTLSGDSTGLRVTWSRLGELLAAVSPREVFLTNAYIGLSDPPPDTPRLPNASDYKARCARLLALEITLWRPECVVCLGNEAAAMLSGLAEGLGDWRQSRQHVARVRDGISVVPAVRVDDVRFTAVAVQHPSARAGTDSRRDDAKRVAEAVAMTTSSHHVADGPGSNTAAAVPGARH